MFKNNESKKLFVVVTIVVCSLVVDEIQGHLLEQTKLLASDGAAGDQFGRVVSIDGLYAIIGAGFDDAGTGSAYIFKKSYNPNDPSWYQQCKLTAADGAVGDLFGWSVFINGDYAALGARGDSDFTGSTYIFQRSENLNDPNWYEQCKLTALDSSAGDNFGTGISISGDYLIVTAPYHDASGSDSGCAYIFKRSANPSDPNWYQQCKLLASDGQAGDHFGQGHGAYISGSYAVVGAPYNNSNTGAAYIFKKSDSPGDPNWYQQCKLVASDAEVGDTFGAHVSLDGDYAIVGIRLNENKGSAYIFKREGENWPEQAKLTASDGGNHFGRGVSINQDYAIVGAPSDSNDAGAAYLFQREGQSWIERKKFTASDTASPDKFGAWSSISGEYAIVSGHKNSNYGSSTGSAYIFKEVCPISDLDYNCWVDFRDVAIMASEWLQCN